MKKTLTDKVIFVLGATKFDGPYESTSFTTAKHLAKDNDVYYIDYPLTLKDYASKSQRHHLESRKEYIFSNTNLITTDNPRFNIVISNPVLPLNFLPEGKFYRQLLKINEQIISKAILKVIRRFKIEDYIYINSFNFHYPDIVRFLKPRLSIYYCVDPLIIDHDKKHGLISELQLVKNSDVVICTSKQLTDEKKEINPLTYFVPNAADLTHSSKALSSNLAVHPFLANIKKPIIGYFGHIERRFDFKLLLEVIRMNPYKSFVFVGPVSEEYVPADFFTLDNAYFPGRVSYDQMPSILKGFDVALIPFKKDEVSSNIFPLKLFEYLGAGKPVVSIDFNPDLKDFTGDSVAYCATALIFSNAINNALKQDSDAERSKRVAIAQANTWEVRLEEIKQIILLNLDKRY